LKVVANSSVLIALSSIQRLTLLSDDFVKVYIPEAVWDEVVNKGIGKSGSEEIKNASWVEIRKITNKDLVTALNEFLDLGEAEAISLAIEMAADIVLLDEKDARLIAVKYNLMPLGSVGILIRAKKQGKITGLKIELDKLISDGNFRISPEIYNRVLTEVGE
jgi:uncharacterized protein